MPAALTIAHFLLILCRLRSPVFGPFFFCGNYVKYKSITSARHNRKINHHKKEEKTETELNNKAEKYHKMTQRIDLKEC